MIVAAMDRSSEWVVDRTIGWLYGCLLAIKVFFLNKFVQDMHLILHCFFYALVIPYPSTYFCKFHYLFLAPLRKVGACWVSVSQYPIGVSCLNRFQWICSPYTYVHFLWSVATKYFHLICFSRIYAFVKNKIFCFFFFCYITLQRFWLIEISFPCGEFCQIATGERERERERGACVRAAGVMTNVIVCINSV